MIEKLAAIAIVLATAPALADKAAADAAFEEAKRLAAAGNLTDACPKFEVSYNEDPQVGSLLNLADCHERLGKLATARAEFHTAVELAHQRNDARESYARDRAGKLDPRVAYLVMHRRAGIDGLHVRLDERDVTAMIDVDLPIDSGHHVIATTSTTGAWSSNLDIDSDGSHRELTVPGDETPIAAPVQPVEPRPSAMPIDRSLAPVDDAGAVRHKRHVLAVTIASAGVASLAAGFVMGGLAIHDVDAATKGTMPPCTKTISGNPEYACDQGGKNKLDAASTDALASDVLVGVGAAAIAAAAIVWFTAPSERVMVTPIASPTTAGAAIAIKF
ncbi:MAG TPA: hypothetical protein VH143_32035 [Kofleriaceae bacterium]|jgi:hypothetical protein|nr:hypothetical protein [Kofleriaceae bacterium]